MSPLGIILLIVLILILFGGLGGGTLHQRVACTATATATPGSAWSAF